MTISRAVGTAIATAILSAWLVLPAVAEARSLECPRPPISVADLVALQRDRGSLQAAFPLSVAPLNERALACFGGRELHFVAFVDRTGGVGGANAYTIKPLWITDPTLTVFGSAHEMAPGVGDGPFFFISVRPGSGDLQSSYAGTWVTVRGHFRDPVATTCAARGVAGRTPDKQQAVAICRTMFVLTSLTPTGPDTSTAGPAANLGESDRSGAFAYGLLIPLLAGLASFLAVVLGRHDRWPDAPIRRRADRPYD